MFVLLLDVSFINISDIATKWYCCVQYTKHHPVNLTSNRKSGKMSLLVWRLGNAYHHAILWKPWTRTQGVESPERSVAGWQMMNDRRSQLDKLCWPRHNLVNKQIPMCFEMTPSVCEFHITRHLLSWGFGRARNSRSHVLYMGISHSRWWDDKLYLINQYHYVIVTEITSKVSGFHVQSCNQPWLEHDNMTCW